MYCWIQFVNTLRIFASIFIKDTDLLFPFFVVSLSGFGTRVMVASYNEFGNIPSSSGFWSSLRKIAITFSLCV